MSERVGGALTRALNALSQPGNTRRLRQVVLAALAVWLVFALSRLLWALVPAAEPALDKPVQIINPVSSGSARVTADPVDINRMVEWHLFGKVGAGAVAVPPPEVVASASSREGIEKGARETRLQLKLRGIVASSEDGMGFAIIENRNEQAVYAVDDKLPVPGKVKLAKVMPKQVVLDNGGTYELLVLFEESGLDAAQGRSPAKRAAPPADARVEERKDKATTELAQSYRERLYKNPQSLAEVVNISAVREGGALLGYRVNPGSDQEQFARLGFKAGDLVKSINGVNLDNPANTMVLYNAMRTAQEVVFELQRGGQSMVLSVNLDSGAVQ
jgi:general secretion pathway protein C